MIFHSSSKMLRTTIHVGLLCLLVSYSFCYVFDVNYSHWYATNGTEYVSVLLQQKSNNFQMLAGAPKDDRLTVCNVISCQNFAFSSKNSAGYEMFGASMSGGDKIGDPTYVCAPRYIATPQYRVNGRCFAVHQKFKSILSLDNVYQQVQLYNSTYEFYYAHGQAGFSVKHVEDDEFLLGAPGVLTWKGTIIKHTDLDTKDVLHPENKVERNSYLGYSIEYGLLSFGGRRRRCVIAGAPRGDNLLGQVYIFDYTYIKDMVLKILKGDQISSYYGASLLVTNQYLLVGAPMYTTKSFEEGCVLVYLNTEDDLIFWQKLCGHHMGGRFGSAMTKIGVFEDSNGHVGVAISAPYADNGVGIVYVYIQTDNGFEEIQQISGRNVSSNTRGFGIGLSNAVDIDGNDYNDFAIASLSSDVLIILKSKKILSFSAELNPYVNKIGTNTKNISVAYCFTYTGRGSSMVGLDVTISLESDGRILVGNATRALGSKIGEKRCEDFVLTLKPQAFDSPSPLKIKVSNKLRECTECPVVYPKETAVSHQIPFVTGCKDENVCVPDLRLQANFVNVSELVIGSREAVSLTILVSNLGETAFLCKMNMTITTEIRQFPPACSKTDNVLRCDISNRLLLNQKKQLEFQLDVKRLDPRLKEIKIDINVESAGFGSGSSATLTVALPVALQSSIALIGFSNPDFFENRESVNFTHEYVVFNNGPSPLLERLFQFKIPESIATSSGVIINAFGVSPLADECIPFDEPPLRKTRELTNLQQMLVAVPQATKYTISCKNNTLVKCRTYLCMIGEVNANSSLKFRFRIEVKTSLMFDALGDDQIEGKTLFLIESQATALHSNREEVSARTVLFKKPTEIINKWMWLVIAVIGSVVILSIIIGILYKLNFFARPMKERLMSEEAHKNERECMIVDDEAEDSSAVFNDIQF